MSRTVSEDGWRVREEKIDRDELSDVKSSTVFFLSFKPTLLMRPITLRVIDGHKSIVTQSESAHLNAMKRVNWLIERE